MKLLCVTILIVLSAVGLCQAVTPARCLLPEISPDQKIRCLAYMPMYRYDDATKKCVRFIYGGCGGTENRFGKIKDCIDTCGATNTINPPAHCLQPQKTGRCFAAFPKFYFDSSENACKEFTYGGCDGNENNFETIEECKNACEIYENEVKTSPLKLVPHSLQN